MMFFIKILMINITHTARKQKHMKILAYLSQFSLIKLSGLFILLFGIIASIKDVTVTNDVHVKSQPNIDVKHTNSFPESGTGAPEQSYCDRYTYFKAFHDGNGGYDFYQTPNAEICGYVAPSLNVDIDNTYGDRFKPVVVTVEFIVEGKPSTAWNFDTSGGKAERINNNTVHIWSQGETGTYYLNVYDPKGLLPRMAPWQYELRSEPRCTVDNWEGSSRIGTDCVGNRQYSSGRETAFIYYGEDDDQIVKVEIAITHYDKNAKVKTPVENIDVLQHTHALVDSYNNQFVQDGVFIEFVLREVWWSDETELRQGELFIRSLPVDIGLGKGFSYRFTCGVAYPNFNFYNAGFAFSNCEGLTDLHELGHVVGLAHGPNNLLNPHQGYIFPDFGHGDYGQCGSQTDDIMSYGNKEHFFNSTQECSDRFPSSDWLHTGPAGDRVRADSAYHWNRIRYDLSLIHDEHSVFPNNKKKIPEHEQRPLILD